MMAQLVEQRIRNAWVVGSIPTSGSIFMGGACRGGNRRIHASLAQLVEQLTLNQFVHGSSPWRGTISFLVRLADGKAGFYLLQNRGIERRIEEILLNLKKVTTSAWGGWRGISCLSLLSHRCLKFPFCRKRFSIDSSWPWLTFHPALRRKIIIGDIFQMFIGRLKFFNMRSYRWICSNDPFPVVDTVLGRR